MRGSARQAAAPTWSGVGACSTSWSWHARIAGVYASGETTQPTRHPVERAVFDSAETTQVRAASAGESCAIDVCVAPSKVMCS